MGRSLGKVTYLKLWLYDKPKLLLCNPLCNDTCSSLLLKYTSWLMLPRPPNKSPSLSLNKAPKLMLCRLVEVNAKAVVLQAARKHHAPQDFVEQLAEDMFCKLF